jgi:hypothetical protein
LETIEILQQEIARLEHELQFREAPENTPSTAPEQLFEGQPPEFSSVTPAEGEDIARLESELASRDETILLLLDELNRLDAAQQASRAEWEQLNGWVDELEHRMEGPEGEGVHRLTSQMTVQEQKAEAILVKAEQDRLAWEAQRQRYQEEIARLQVALDQAAAPAETTASNVNQDSSGRAVDSGVLEALQSENLRLRAAWQELVERAASAEHSESLDARLAECLNERNQLRRKLEQVEDERKRDRREHNAAVMELQSRLTAASHAAAHPPPPERHAEAGGRERDLDLRVRALRQHLQEIEEQERTEREERRQKNLVVRLSKLWSRTSPR